METLTEQAESCNYRDKAAWGGRIAMSENSEHVITCDAASVERMRDAAMRMPGVSDIMEIYAQWQALDQATAQHRQIVDTGQVITVFASPSTTVELR